jgi:hypothetical protein
MAKAGLSYYNVDTDRYADRRIKKLKHTFGCSGIAVYDYLLCEVYRDRGCFLEWGEDTAFDVADYFGLKENLVKEIVKYCGVVGLFDSTLLSGGIITSEAIQQRYLDMSHRAKRTNIAIPEEIRLLPEETAKLTEETAKTPEVFRKVNKSKVNNIRENKFSLSNAHTCARTDKEIFLEIFFFERNFISAKDELVRFLNHYEANGWCRNNSTVPVKDRLALARSWKPQNDKPRFPQELVEWLYKVYRNAEAKYPTLRLKMFDIAGAEPREGGYAIYCDEDTVRVIEDNLVPADFKLCYLVKR